MLAVVPSPRLRRLSRALGGLLAVCALSALSAEFVVSPTGDDTAPGTRDQPFRTLVAAQRAARGFAGREPVTVLLRGGTHELAEPWVVTPEDSGSAEQPVVYAAWPGEQPVISGGRKLELRWEPHRDGIWKAAVPPDLHTDQLFLNGEAQVMARFPNRDPGQRIFQGFDPDAFSPARWSRWANPRGGYFHAMHVHEWGGFHFVMTGKDAEGRVLLEGGWQNNRRDGLHPRHRFVENLFEELDAPGEWFHDRAASLLYLAPPPGTDLRRATLEAVRLRSLVEFRGWAGRPVRFLTLRGLTFRHAARTFMDNREPLLRSDWTIHRGAAVFLEETEDCQLEACTWDRVGGNAVLASGYHRRLSIRGAHIVGAGANGIALVGKPGAVRAPLFQYAQRQTLHGLDRTPGPQSSEYPADCLIEDCLIHETGRIEKQSAAVQIAMAARITVRHCSVYDVPRAGINIGDGCWGGHVIEGCDVFDTVLETGDHGSFNSWGRDRFWVPEIRDVDARVKAHPELPFLDVTEPIVLRNNRWRCDHGWDIDLDDGSSRYVLENNLCLNGGIKLREGFGRVVENNLMLGNSFHPHVWYAESRDLFRRNIVQTPYRPIGMPDRWGLEIDHNLLPDAESLADSQAEGRDLHSRAGDPRFLDPARGDYRVADDSPAIALGFRNFPMDRFGVRLPALRALARQPRLP